ncbi:hypothetical protein [Bradyrhizobium sp. USDA 10063]
MPIPGTPELRDGSSQDGRIVVTAYQIGGRDPPAIIRGPGEHSTVGTDIGRVDKKRFGEVGERRFSASKLPVRLRAENEAMSGRWRFNTAASIRVFECRYKILGGQRLRRQALKRDM